MAKQITIKAPKGHEIDLKKSGLSKGIIQFKEVKKCITYQDVFNKLFEDREVYVIKDKSIIKTIDTINSIDVEERMGSRTTEQLEAIFALNKLCNVAKYLNGDWAPNKTQLISLTICSKTGNILVSMESWGTNINSSVYFKDVGLAVEAIEILGKEEIKKALTLNH